MPKCEDDKTGNTLASFGGPNFPWGYCIIFPQKHKMLTKNSPVFKKQGHLNKSNNCMNTWCSQVKSNKKGHKECKMLFWGGEIFVHTFHGFRRRRWDIYLQVAWQLPLAVHRSAETYWRRRAIKRGSPLFTVILTFHYTIVKRVVQL